MPIRKANPADIPVLSQFLQQILLVHHQARPDIFKSQGSKYSPQELEKLLSQENTPIFVYEDEKGQLLGHLFCTIKEPDSPVLNPIRTLFIEDLCVDEKARGQRIGEQLYGFAEDFARQIGCHNLTLNVWNDNAGALRFYERQGLRPQETVMEKLL
ncbi:N-acetyltransferase family protein [Streptococcus panodentis]|uniref:GNAT family N-acetyltransferase n=1 Tax=Streptococcus panodentis TaxID=1581472 RepID=A0ABS5AZF3_9STRE|nr:GNAT family N-acetyltransferase [Streptococcus panodentis]MBP2621945.1 GNAT family N-acetyltransferase [Streptococcus panodentis]